MKGERQQDEGSKEENRRPENTRKCHELHPHLGTFSLVLMDAIWDLSSGSALPVPDGILLAEERGSVLPSFPHLSVALCHGAGQTPGNNRFLWPYMNSNDFGCHKYGSISQTEKRL